MTDYTVTHVYPGNHLKMCLHEGEWFYRDTGRGWLALNDWLYEQEQSSEMPINPPFLDFLRQAENETYFDDPPE